MVDRAKLLDTNILIDYLRGHEPTIWYIEAIKRSKQRTYISAITHLELFAGKSSRSKIINQNIKTLLGAFHVLPVDGEIARKAGEMKRDQNVTALDAAIAETALKNQLTLVTRNSKHFVGIPSLDFKEP